MPLYKITVVDKIARYLVKTFEAPSENVARSMAEEDCWTSDDGWEELPYEGVTENCIEEIEPIDTIEAVK